MTKCRIKILLKVMPQIGMRATKKRLDKQTEKTTRMATTKDPVSIRITKPIVTI